MHRSMRLGKGQLPKEIRALDDITPILEADWLIRLHFPCDSSNRHLYNKATAELGIKLSLEDLIIEKLVDYYNHLIGKTLKDYRYFSFLQDIRSRGIVG